MDDMKVPAKREFYAWFVKSMTLWLISITALILVGACLWSRQRVVAAWKRDARQLQSTINRYQIFFDQSPRPMYVFDLNSLAFTDVNAAALRHYGYSRDEFLSLKADGIRPPEEMTLLMDRIQSGTQTPAMTRHIKRDGTLIDVEVSVHHLMLDDREVVLVS